MAVTGLRSAGVALGAALLASCTVVPKGAAPLPPPPPVTTPAPTPVTPPPASLASTAIGAGLTAGPTVASLAMTLQDAEEARRSFVESCPRLLSRSDASGISADWTLPCANAPKWGGDPIGFFAAFFESAQVGNGAAFLTGYYEPQIAGVRVRQPGYEVPVYAMPSDLVPDPAYTGGGRAPMGRIDESGQFVPYFERGEIATGALDGKVPVIGWARDAIDFFFLQIQGSGQLIGPNGEVVRIGYAGQNGREYVAIGRVLRDRGVFQPGEATMAKIVEWLRANPAQADEVMNQNKSWVFFRELTGDGPLGALNVPVRPHASVAADPKFVPLGAPVWIDAARPEADGVWIAQDTGGAIKGANRFDTFWGAGPEAARIAGGMSSDARAYLLLPKGTLARLGVR